MKNLAQIRKAVSMGLLGAVLACGQALAVGPAALADRPLDISGGASAVRSNLMFILDDSGSMSSDFLPDGVSRSNVCYGAADVNRIFFDPKQSYDPPVNADGTSKPAASFDAAWIDGFKTSAGTVDLRNNHPNTANLVGALISGPDVTVSPKEPACGSSRSAACDIPDTVTTAVNTDVSTTTTEVKWARVAAAGFDRCTRTAGSCALQKTTTVTVTELGGKFLWATRKAGAASSSCATADFDIVRYSPDLSAAVLAKYANWYAYYRSRVLAMRTAAGKAFGKIDASRFRVGFATIHNTSNTDGSEFLNIRDFDTGTQKADFFSKLYTVAPGGFTPLRPALERAGHYYANKLAGQVDPMQYSCQRNYTILSTDGYWNSSDEGDGYTPKQLDGSTAIGNQDAGNAVPRPLRDEVNSVGVSNSLADIAMYFYETDLRTVALDNCSGAAVEGVSHDVCANKVLSNDAEKPQRMTTFTLGLGADGTLKYDKLYETQNSGDFWNIRQGTGVWPDPRVTSTSSSVVERIDDLWHAAVNGRGFYYSAADSVELANSLANALDKIDAITGSASAAATSSLTPSAGDNWLFIPLYETVTWEGKVRAFKIDAATGAMETAPDAPVWSADERIKGQGARTILFRKTDAANKLAAFTYANLSAAGLGASFDNACAGALSVQCVAMSTDEMRAKVTGNNLVAYLAGSSTHETSAAAADDRLFRARGTPLGDIVNGAPVYVKKPPLKYADDGYGAYVAAQAARQAVLYVAANDGMLHAIKVSDDATGGTELWAYVPTPVMPNMPLLADLAYAGKHRFFVDGAPVVADVHDGSAWRTILVGGLGKGGRAYYALDITDPAAPKSLWEFSDSDLGYSFGNPIVTKNKAGTWVVAFSSGYNNTGPGDGQGHLYVLNAVTGAQLKKISTGRGDTTTPSNLGKINAWVDDDTDNTAKRIYGADMLGNVWRFDFDDNLPGDDAFLLATVGANQPITTKPVLTEVVAGASKLAVVTVATGRYLGDADVGDSNLQSIYTFKDDLSTTSLGALRDNASMVKQKLLANRTGLDSPSAVAWATQAGWYLDLDAGGVNSGERVNVDVDQQFNQLVVAGNIPTSSVCAPGGTSWLYFLDVGTGKVLLSYEGDAMVAGTTSIVTSTGKLVTLVQGVDGTNTPRKGAEPGGTTPGTLRRTSWRELVE